MNVNAPTLVGARRMRPAAAVLLALSGCVVTPYYVAPQIVHDDFRGTDRAVVRGIGLDALGMDLSGQPGDLESRVRVDLGSYSSHGWRYLRCHSVDLLVDGFPISVTETKHDGTVLSGASVFEQVSFGLYPDTLRLIASSTVARGRLCDTVFTFDAQDKAVIQDFLGLLAGPGAGAQEG